MPCAEVPRVQAYFDAELDAASAHQVESHLEHCPTCRTLLGDLRSVRARLRRDVGGERAPPGLRSAVLEKLDRADASPVGAVRARLAWLGGAPFWTGVAGGLGGAAAAAMLAWVLMSAPRATPANFIALADSLVRAHVHSLLPGQLVAVTSSDRHTVKPWFAGHADVSPAVADFAAQGYPLVGGRSDAIGSQRAAVVVYRHGAHLINVFTWAPAARAFDQDVTRSGYHLAFWQVGDLEYCAVSDTGWRELQVLVAMMRATAQSEEYPPEE